MGKEIAQLGETARWGAEWQSSGDWSAHTVTAGEAARLAAGYLRMLRAASGRGDWAAARGLGIGSGAGHIEAALATYGVDMAASEWNEEGLQLIAAQNPQLERCRVDLLDFSDCAAWDLIVCRELYPFTRTNAFSEQMEILSRLVDALRPGGVLLLVGSDVSYPHCMDYRLMRNCLREDARVERIVGPVLEFVVKRTSGMPMTRVGYRILNPFGRLALSMLRTMRQRPVAAIGVHAIVRA